MDNDEKILGESPAMTENGHVEEEAVQEPEASDTQQEVEAAAEEAPAESQLDDGAAPSEEAEPAEASADAEAPEAAEEAVEAEEPAEAEPAEASADAAELEVAEPEAVEEVVETEEPAEAEPAEASADAAELEVAEPEAVEETVEAEEPAESAEEEPISDEDLFLQYMSGEVEVEGAAASLAKGQLVEGTIVSIEDSEILVDVGAKSEGVIQSRDLEKLDRELVDSLEVGQTIRVSVISPEGRSGHPILSLRRALEEEDWHTAEEYLLSKDVYGSKIAGYNKGGLIVPFGRIRGFVPASQVSMDRRRNSSGSTPQERWGDMVGEEVGVKVIEVDRGRNRLILSERAAMQEKRAEMRDALMAELEAGQIRTGRVVRLTDFGAFVDIGGADGLIHLSELAWRHVNHPKEVLKVGDEVEVEVISVDRERQRIGLSRKNVQPDPWDTLAEEYHPGQLVQGKVTKLTKFGAFASLVERPEIEGLIHISELADHRVAHPRDVVNEGDTLTLRILRIEPDRRRLGLSLKRVDSPEYMDDDWSDFS